MNLRKFERSMKTRQTNWDVQSCRINPITHILDIKLSYIGAKPPKFVRWFKFIRVRWLQRKVTAFVTSAQELTPALRPRVKTIQVYVG
jgi:hypothetical protein